MVKRRKLLLSIKHEKRRVNFALKYKNWTMEDWTRATWSVETKINRIGSDGRMYVWKKNRQAFIGQGIVKFGGGFLMVWECMG